MTFGEIGLELGAERAAASRRGRTGSAPPTRPTQTTCEEPHDPVRHPVVETGRFPVPAVLRAERRRCRVLARSGWTTCSRTRCRWRSSPAAIANDGVMMRPQARHRDPRPERARRARRSIPRSTAADLRRDRRGAHADDGVGRPRAARARRRRSRASTVAGKTGTRPARRGPTTQRLVHGFAPARGPQIAVAVIVLDGGDLGSEATGGRIAAPDRAGRSSRPYARRLGDDPATRGPRQTRSGSRSAGVGTGRGELGRAAWPRSIAAIDTVLEPHGRDQDPRCRSSRATRAS